MNTFTDCKGQLQDKTFSNFIFDGYGFHGLLFECSKVSGQLVTVH